MSGAPRLAKWRSRSNRCAWPTSPPVQRKSTSPSSATASYRTTGRWSGKTKAARGLLARQVVDHLRDHVARALQHGDAIAQRAGRSRPISSRLCSVTFGHRDPADEHRLADRPGQRVRLQPGCRDRLEHRADPLSQELARQPQRAWRRTRAGLQSGRSALQTTPSMSCGRSGRADASKPAACLRTTRSKPDRARRKYPRSAASSRRHCTSGPSRNRSSPTVAEERTCQSPVSVAHAEERGSKRGLTNVFPPSQSRLDP